MIMLKMLNFI